MRNSYHKKDRSKHRHSQKNLQNIYIYISIPLNAFGATENQSEEFYIPEFSYTNFSTSEGVKGTYFEPPVSSEADNILTPEIITLKNKIIKDFDDVCVEELPIGVSPKRPGDYPIIP
jgi:hypothetical protein